MTFFIAYAIFFLTGFILWPIMMVVRWKNNRDYVAMEPIGFILSWFNYAAVLWPFHLVALVTK